jgi:hypothetical protein
MKVAPWVALAAVALLMSGSLLTRRDAQEGPLRKLDFTGVDTLVMKSKSRVEVTLGKFPGRMVDPFDDDVEATVTRSGNVLTITNEYGWLQIEAPETLHRIEGADQINVAHGNRVADMLVQGSESISWAGDVDRLRIIHRTKPSTGTCRCPEHEERTVGSVLVQRGQVGSLEILSERGKVSLGQVEDIGHATLELGEDAEYDLGGLHGKPPEVTLIALRATPPVAPAKVAKPAPVDPAAEPPRSR